MQILADGAFVGTLERNGDLSVTLNSAADAVANAKGDQDVNLDILVMQIGRCNWEDSSFTFDLKGLVSGIVLLNGALSLTIFLEQCPQWCFLRF